MDFKSLKERYSAFCLRRRVIIINILAILVILTAVYSFTYDIPNTHLKVRCEQYFEVNQEMDKFCVATNCGEYFVEDYVDWIKEKNEANPFG